MTSSKTRDLQTPFVIFARPLDDVIFHQHPISLFFGKIIFMVKFKNKKSGFSPEYYSKQKSIKLLLPECFRCIEKIVLITR